MDHQQFGERVRELLRWKGLRQADLADVFGVSKGYVNQILTGKKPVTPDFATGCIRFLAENRAIIERSVANDLLDWAGCKGFSDADWARWPLNSLVEDTTVSRRPVGQRSAPSANPFHEENRARYLEQVLRRYNSLTLPVGSRRTLPLSAVFQSLSLRQERFFPEELAIEDRRALLDEPMRSEDDPRRARNERLDSSFSARMQKPPSSVIANTGEEALEQSPAGRLVILGNPGSGKTTLLKNWICQAAQRARGDSKALIPLFVFLPDFATAAVPFQAYVSIVAGKLGIDTGYGQELWKAVQEGQAFVCLDGLDEVPSHQRQEILDWLNTVAGVEGNVWVLSSRFSEYRSGQLSQGHFVEWEVQFLTGMLRKKLVQQLLSVMEKPLIPSFLVHRRHHAARFLKALAKHPQASTWGKNPLLLSLCVIVFVERGVIPASRTELYEQVIHAVLRTRMQDPLRRMTVLRVAAALAFTLHQQKRRIVTHEELFLLLPDIRVQQKETWSTEGLARDLMYSGLLEVVAGETYGFWHQTYQEYLAAKELAERWKKQQEAMYEQAWMKRTYSRWGEVLCLLVGVLTRDRKEESDTLVLHWVKALLAQPATIDIGDFGLVLALRSLGEIDLKKVYRKSDWVKLQEQGAQEWLTRLFMSLKHRQEKRQLRLLSCAEAISQFAKPVVASLVQTLLEAAQSSIEMTENVLRVCGKLGMHAPVQYMLHALRAPHEHIRKAAIQALTELDTVVPLKLLLKELRSSEAIIREAAMETARELAFEELVPSFLDGLHDPDWLVRLAAVEALANYGDEKGVVKALFACLGDEEEFVRAAAVEAIGKSGRNVPLKPLFNMLEDPSHAVRGAVIQVLGEKTPLEKLIEEVNISEAQAYYSFAYRPAIEVLARLEEQLTPEERSDMIQTSFPHRLLPLIRTFQQETPTEELIQVLYSGSKQLLLEAAHLLREKQDWAVLEAFVASLQKSHGYLRAVALSLLSTLKDYVPLQLFVASLRDPYFQARFEAIKALEFRKDLSSVHGEQVAALLDDEDRRVRATALRVLKQIASHMEVELPFLEKLFQALQSDFRSIVHPAGDILETVKARISVEQRTALFRHPDGSLRLEAVKLLGVYASREQVMELLDDEMAAIRVEALQSLQGRWETFPSERIIACLDDPDPRVYYAAIAVLKDIGEWEILQDFCDEDGFPNPPPGVSRHEDEEDTSLFRRKEEPNTLYDIIRLLDGRDESVEGEVDETMQQINARVLREHYSDAELVKLFEEGNNTERKNALLALEQRAPQELLLRAVKDADWEVRKAGLKIWGKDAPQEQLLYALGDTFEEVRDVAVGLIQDRGEELPEASLLDLLHHRQSSIRASALRALGKRGSLKKVIDAIGDSEEEVRKAAITVLRDQYPEMIEVVLTDLAGFLTEEEPSEFLQSVAKSFLIEIIGTLEHAPVRFLNPVVELLEWPYWEVRMKAAQALGILHFDVSDEAVQRLRRIREDEQEPQSVRTAADDALAEILSVEKSFEDEDSDRGRQ